MNIQTDTSLLPYNTFHINEKANEFVEIHTLEDLKELIDWAQMRNRQIAVIGGGSNILLTGPVADIVLLNKLKGIEIAEENDNEVFVQFRSGEIWHQCVLRAVERGWGGIENLSLIPGTIGAAPIQNIGAYGVELKDVFEELQTVNLKTGASRLYRHSDCRFGYRDSVFKQLPFKNEFIVSVTLPLQKTPVYHIEYGNLKEVVQHDFAGEVNIRNISNAVIKIRNSKLPDPAVLGNAGSFFKNPVVPLAFGRKLQNDYPELPLFEVEEGAKISAAWLIEQCHWKGFREGDYGVHDRQALVLVNYSNARGKDIVHLAQRIITSVQQGFNITLQPEVNIW